MNTRVKFSVVLLSLGLILAILPSPAKRILKAKPERLVSLLNDEKSWFTADQVARFVVSGDINVRIIDLRPESEFRKMTIPGSVNIPYNEFIKKNPASFLAAGDVKNILCSDVEQEAANAFILAKGLNFKNTYILKGSVNEWVKTVMNNSFSGDKITARENALFETRTRASKMYTDFNNMPDSLKQKFFESRRLATKKLDGGCE
ncbi:MAG: rhodanese-like domain-containing protein [Bacteroidales bacterium]